MFVAIVALSDFVSLNETRSTIAQMWCRPMFAAVLTVLKVGDGSGKHMEI